jgi:hypothetical protein
VADPARSPRTRWRARAEKEPTEAVARGRRLTNGATVVKRPALCGEACRDDANRLSGEVLVAGRGDWVGLWEVVRTARELDAGPQEDVPRVVVSVIRALHERGLVRIGCPRSGGGFEPWPLSSEQAAARIVQEWQELGERDPDIGEICWLENTPAGDEAARRLRRA